MIRIFLGAVGSGKTLLAVKEMYHNQSHRLTYSNIIPKDPIYLPNVRVISSDMIITKTVTGYKKTGEEVYTLNMNDQYWKDIKEPINVVLDEAHQILNPRRSMSKVNIIVSDWLALIRRVLGETDSGYGTLTLITQLPNRIDIIAREMCTHVRYHIGHFSKSCTACHYTWQESSESPEPNLVCPVCSNYKLKKHSHKAQVYHFRNMTAFEAWKVFNVRSWHRMYFVNDVEMYFPLYNTFQWENLFSDLYV